MNGLNQLTSTNGTAMSSDTRGNLTSDGATSCSYDIYNRMAGAGSATLSYDPVGRLRQTVGASTTNFLYDGAETIAEYNSSGTMLRRFVHGPGIDEPIVWYEGTGTTDRRWLVQSEQNSVIATTNASGAALNINTYDEYGVPGGSNVGRFQFTGQMWLPEASLYSYKARDYSAALGRFMQPDPIGQNGGLNLYAYASGDPVNRVDPLGLSDDDIIVRATRRPHDWNWYLIMMSPQLDAGGGGPTGDGGGGSVQPISDEQNADTCPGAEANNLRDLNSLTRAGAHASIQVMGIGVIVTAAGIPFGAPELGLAIIAGGEKGYEISSDAELVTGAALALLGDRRALYDSAFDVVGGALLHEIPRQLRPLSEEAARQAFDRLEDAGDAPECHNVHQ